MSSIILTLHTAQKGFVSEDYSHILQVYFVDNFWPFTPQLKCDFYGWRNKTNFIGFWRSIEFNKKYK